MKTALKRVLFVILTGVAALPLVATFTSPDLESTRLTGTGDGRDSDTQDPEIRDDDGRDAENQPTVTRTPSRFLVEVTGRDFRWHFRYLEPDVVPSTSGAATSFNELHLPVNTTVEIHLTSDDYIYVFSVPELGIEQIAVPDLTSEFSCHTTEPFSCNLLVSPLCGFRFYHDELMGRIVVQRHVRFTKRLEPT